jgi:hypothetical protein
MDPRSAYFLILADQRHTLTEIELERTVRHGHEERPDDPGGPGLVARLRRRLAGVPARLMATAGRTGATEAGG